MEFERLNHKDSQNLRLCYRWQSLFGDFFHSEFLGLQKSSISESYQSLMTLKSRKTTIHLHFQKWSLLVFPDNSFLEKTMEIGIIPLEMMHLNFGGNNGNR